MCLWWTSCESGGGGVKQIRNVLPQTFNWLLFAAALALMSMPGAHALGGGGAKGS